MLMGLKGRSERERFFRSFSFAWDGILTTFKTERNFQFHIVICILVTAASFFFHISLSEWIIVLFLMGGMLSLELMNTALERIVDLVTSEYHPLAKAGKDAAAGAVLIYAVLAVIIGLIIFIPKVL
ncbi:MULTISPECIES: diacylglycerol kinase family protein [Bacillaceae]|uniref:diacylglycerol kinase family protein n=1 Tax=Bacillaceae TaxID=186817 RepID=UPI0026CD52A5